MPDPLTPPPLPTLRGEQVILRGRRTPMSVTGCVIPSTPGKKTATARRGGVSGTAAATTPRST
jgi:hypothetical protein